MLTACDSDGAIPTFLPHAALGPDAAVSPDRQMALLCDGSLTNAAEIQNELVGAGYRLRSPSVNELLLAAARVWSPAGLATRLRGSFAIAIYEADPLRLTLLRDRFGSRQLAYRRHDGQVHFCSTIRGLRQADPGVSSELDPLALGEFLELGWISDVRSIYRGIEKVPAGGVVQIEMGAVRTGHFWAPSRPARGWSLGFDNVCAVVEQLFLDSVSARLTSQSSVAALGGPGIESALLAWALATLDARIPLLRVAQAGEPAEITDSTANLARRLGLRQEVIWISALEEPRVFELADAFDEPYASPAAFQMLRIGKAVNRRAQVVLSGDGVDWLFLGSPLHVRCWGMDRLLREMEIDEPALVHQARAVLGLPRSFLEPGRRSSHLFGPRLREAILPAGERPVRGSLLEDYLRYDRIATFDRDRAGIGGAAAYFGIENRSPFLDENLWEFTGRVPYWQRLYRGRSRALLRGLASMHAGEVFATRQKPSPAAHVRELLASRWLPALEELLRDSHLVSDGWVDREAVRREYDLARQREAGSLALWHFLVLEYWLRRSSRRRLSPAVFAAAAG